MKTQLFARLAVAGMIMGYTTTNAQPSTVLKDVQSTNIKMPAGTFSTAFRTAFNPAVHGFRFVNDFQTEFQIAGLNGPRFGGLCGGMAYSALDYFKAAKAIPTQTHRPASGTTLYRYIYDRQQTSSLSNADKWAELVANPLGARTNEFFNWGLQGFNGGRVQELIETIKSGSPVPLGLFKAGNAGIGPHHQVLAIGYDMGRYKGDLGDFKEDLKIFIYDPNFPNRTVTLRPNLRTQSYYYEERPDLNWMTYFVDKKFRPATPPNISTTNLPTNSMVQEILLEIRTGGDDLRGGNDNVHAIVKYADGTSDTYENINNRVRWIDNYTETVVLRLRKPAQKNQIKCVTLKTTFGGGIGGDNWNMNCLRIIAKEGSNESVVYLQEGKPLVRFDGNNTPFDAIWR